MRSIPEQGNPPLAPAARRRPIVDVGAVDRVLVRRADDRGQLLRPALESAQDGSFAAALGVAAAALLSSDRRQPVRTRFADAVEGDHRIRALKS